MEEYGTFCHHRDTSGTGTTQQLLQKPSSKLNHKATSKTTRKCRFESQTRWLEWFFFMHIRYLLAISRQNQTITLDDLWELEPELQSAVAGEKLFRVYEQTGQSLLCAIGCTQWRRLVASGLLRVTMMPLGLAPVVLVYQLLTALTISYDLKTIFGYLFAIHCATLLGELLSYHADSLVRAISREIASSCHYLVFQHALMRDCGGRKGVANVSRIHRSAVFGLSLMVNRLHGGWVSALEIVDEVYVLNRLLHVRWTSIAMLLSVLVCLGVLSALSESVLRLGSYEKQSQRVKAIHECFRGIQSVRLNGWERKFDKRINDARANENKAVRRFMNMIAIRFNKPLRVEDCVAGIVFSVVGIQHDQFSSAIAFAVTVMSQRMSATLMQWYFAISSIIHGYRGTKELEKHLQASMPSHQNIRSYRSSKYSPSVVVATEGACFGYDTSTSGYTLMNVNFYVHKGELVVVHGKTGEGKTTLIAALLGEVNCINGEAYLACECRVAYCSQEPWLQSLTIRENILFGSPYEETKYSAVLDACCLMQDLSTFLNVDNTVVGPRGMDLSGQKARIALARACYADADLYVLDCPLASVDAVVQMDVFRKCIVELVRYKTVLLVTHNAEFIHSPMVDRLLEIAGRTVSVHAFKVRDDPQLTHGMSQRVRVFETKASQTSVVKDARTRGELIHGISLLKTCHGMIHHRGGRESSENAPIKDTDAITNDDITSALKFLLFKLPGVSVFTDAAGLLLIGGESLVMMKNLWLVSWSSSLSIVSDSEFWHQALVFDGFVMGSLTGLVFGIVCLSVPINDSVNDLFRGMVSSLLGAPLSLFYHQIPLGRVMGYLVSDMEVVDHYCQLWPRRLMG